MLIQVTVSEVGGKRHMERGTFLFSPVLLLRNLVQQSEILDQEKGNLKIWKTGRSCSWLPSGVTYQSGQEDMVSRKKREEVGT